MEKERYYSLIDCNGNFELRDYESNREFHSLYELDVLLNQQDNRIKELEKQYQDLKEDNDATTESLYACRNYLDKVTSRMFALEREIERFDVKCRKAYQEGLLQKQFDKDAEIMLLKQKAIIPKCCIGCRLYMIPTKSNGLNTIREYVLLSITLSDIGLRYEMSLCKKERGVEPFYCASEDMFNVSIFFSKEDSEKAMRENKQR